MILGRAHRPISVVLACGASGLLLAGFLPPGALLGVLAIGAAWLPLSPPPPE